ncbi:MAG: hypothetical protein N2439_01075 [Anaerolineae bacterium]|nr:hypothetical protein [Anaerolineae bacterium]
MRQLRKANWLFMALLAGAVILALTGLGLLAAYFYFSRPAESSSAWISPVGAVRPKAVAPDLAVLTLAGEGDDRIIRAALDAGEIETAYAGLAFSVLLPDTLRSGHWLLLADRYQKIEPDRALVALRAALDIAALSPTLSDMGRADIALQIASRYATLRQPTAARLALAQAETIGRHSLLLLPAQRRTILEQVEAAYRKLGDGAAADTVRRDLDVASAGPGVHLSPPPAWLPALRGAVTLPPAVVSAIADRQHAAAQMAGRWLSASPAERTALVEALGRALLTEDAIRSAFYEASADLPAADRLALLHERIAWLTVKYRIATGGFGAALVPDWSPRTDALRAELAAAYTDLINGYGQQLDTLSPADASQARAELLRTGLLAVRLGLFPDPAAETILYDQLHEASRDLWTRQGNVGLVITTQEQQGGRLYLLAGSDERNAQDKK